MEEGVAVVKATELIARLKTMVDNYGDDLGVSIVVGHDMLEVAGAEYTGFEISEDGRDGTKKVLSKGGKVNIIAGRPVDPSNS